MKLEAAKKKKKKNNLSLKQKKKRKKKELCEFVIVQKIVPTQRKFSEKREVKGKITQLHPTSISCQARVEQKKQSRFI